MAKFFTELSCSQDGTEVGSFLAPGTRREEVLMSQPSNVLHTPEALKSPVSQNTASPKRHPRAKRGLFFNSETHQAK